MKSGDQTSAFLHAIVAIASSLFFCAVPALGAAPADNAAAARAASALHDERLDAAEPVFGVTVGKEPRAYVMADLEKAGPVVHDLVGGLRFEVKLGAAGVQVVGPPASVHAEGATVWGTWAHLHPETSIWRRATQGESGQPLDGRDIRLTESHDYRTELGCTFGCEAVEDAMSSKPRDHPGVFVIAGTLTNTATTPVHHVVLRYEFLDAKGNVVYREEGFNRAAESLAETQQAAPSAPVAIPPIAPGASDTFRMLFLNEELPPFHHSRITVGRVY